MSEQDVTQESSGAEIAETNALAPVQAERKSAGQLARASLADMAERDAAHRALDAARSLAVEASKAFDKYHRKFGWTKAQFTEYWQLRGQPRIFGQKQSEWEKLLNREEKRVKAKGKPRKNKDVKGMPPEAAKAHRRKQVQKAVALHRENKAMEADLQAAIAGERPLTDDELAQIEAAEASQALKTPEARELDDMLASLRMAEAAEGD